MKVKVLQSRGLSGQPEHPADVPRLYGRLSGS